MNGEPNKSLKSSNAIFSESMFFNRATRKRIECVNQFEIWLKFWKDHSNINRSSKGIFEIHNSKKKIPPKSKKKNQNFVFFQNSHRKNYNEFQNFPSTIGWYGSEVTLYQKSCFFDQRLYLFTCRPFYPYFMYEKWLFGNPSRRGGAGGAILIFF